MRTPSLVPQLLVVLCCRLLLNTVRRFVYPFAPALSRTLGVPLAAVTSIIATTQVAALCGLFGGLVADRVGNRRVMRAGLALLSGGMLLCLLFPSYWFIFVGLVLASLGKTIFDPSMQAFIGSHVPFERRGRVIGIIETSWAGSTLVGVPLLGLIISHYGLAAAFSLLALLGGLSWLAVGRVLPADGPSAATEPAAAADANANPIVSPTSPASPTGPVNPTIPTRPASPSHLGVGAALGQLVRIRPALGMLAFGFWVSIANDSLFVVYGAWFEQAFLVSIVTLGFSAVAIGAAELLGESLTALVADRLGLKRAVVIGLLLVTLAYLLLPFLGASLPLAMVGMFLVFLFFEFLLVSSFSLSSEILPQARGTMMGGYYATAGVGRMIGVLVGGQLWQWGGIRAVTSLSAGLTLLALLCLLWGLHGWRHKAAEESEGENGA